MLILTTYNLGCAIGWAGIYLTEQCVCIKPPCGGAGCTPRQAVGSALSGRAHKGSTQSAAAWPWRMWPPSSFRWPDSSHGHRAQILFITRPPTGQAPRNERGLPGPVSQCCMPVCQSTAADKQQTDRLTFSWLPRIASWLSLCPLNVRNLGNHTTTKET